MQKLSSFPLIGCAIAIGVGLAMVWAAPNSRAQRDVVLLEPDEAQEELERANRAREAAQTRADRLAEEANAAGEAAERTAREAAKVAAQVQAAEANIAAARARYSIAQSQRAALSQRLAVRRRPLVRLTGALQTSSRRPLALSALQPGSLKDVVYVRAVLDAAVPEIRKRTAALRGELEEGRRIEQRAARALASLEQSETELRTRRLELAELEAQQRLASREARGAASREGERALALAEEARDLDALMGRIGDAAELRRELAALSGPIMRPNDIGTRGGKAGAADPIEPSPSPSASSSRIAGFQLPVQGRTIASFGQLKDSGLKSTSLDLAPSAGAQIVAPATGRIAFAGPYRGFGRIVIIEHESGWTSLVTGLERVTVEVGDSVIGGGPLGVAGSEDPEVTIELRQDGKPVNPLNYLG